MFNQFMYQALENSTLNVSETKEIIGVRLELKNIYGSSTCFINSIPFKLLCDSYNNLIGLVSDKNYDGGKLSYLIHVAIPDNITLPSDKSKDLLVHISNSKEPELIIQYGNISITLDYEEASYFVNLWKRIKFYNRDGKICESQYYKQILEKENNDD